MMGLREIGMDIVRAIDSRVEDKIGPRLRDLERRVDALEDVSEDERECEWTEDGYVRKRPRGDVGR